MEIFSCILALATVVTVSIEALAVKSPPACDIYLAPSKIPHLGRGVFAGRDFEEDEILSIMPTVLVSDFQSISTQLSYYVYSMALDINEPPTKSANEDFNAGHKTVDIQTLEESKYSQFVFGPLLVNSGSSKQVNVKSFWANKNIIHPHVMRQYAHSVSHDFGYVVKSKVFSKAEIFASYGGSEWFSSRNIPYNESLVYDVSDISYSSLEELAQVGVCLSDLYLKESAIPMAGRGVFAKRSYKQGEKVTTSPVLVTSRHLAVEDAESVLLNYLLSRDNTDLALLPITLAAMFNHANKWDAVLRMQWDHWPNSSQTLEQILSMHPRELASLPYAPLDIAYIADRDIAEGDELTIYYGSDWESAWLRYLDELMVWRSGEASLVRLSEKPEFRRHISIPDEMLPESGSFLVDCVADNIDCSLNVNRLKLDINALHTFKASIDFFEKVDSQRRFIEVGWNEADVTSISECSCDFYLAPSRLPSLSRGVFAGRMFKKNEVLENTASVTVAFEHAMQTQLANYVYSVSVSDYGMMGPGPYGYSADLQVLNKIELVNNFGELKSQFAFGVSLLLNHAPSDIDVKSFYPNKYGISPNASKQYAHTLSSNFGMLFERDISAGHEIFSSYGEGNWFETRDIKYNETKFSDSEVKYNMEDLSQVGVCLSDLYLKESAIPMAGRGVFAKRSYKQGEKVTTSPVLVTSRHLAVEDAESVLLNYLLSRDNTDLALLPITLAAMFNNAGKLTANIVMRWDARSGTPDKTLEQILSMHPRELASMPYAPLDIAYIADRDIAEGDELTIYYGSDWESAWLRYLDELMVWRSGEASLVRLSEKPEFRRHISIPDEMLPESGSFLVDCVADNIDCSLQHNRLLLESNSFIHMVASKQYILNDGAQKERIQFVGARLGNESYDAVGPLCSIFMAPSKIPFLQRGIFAGIDFSENDVLDNAASLFISLSHAKRSQLWYYVHSLDESSEALNFIDDINRIEYGHLKGISAIALEDKDDLVMFYFGVAPLINHIPGQDDVKSAQTSTFRVDPDVTAQFGHTIAPDIGVIFNRQCPATYEITKEYADDWFGDRGKVWYNEGVQLDIPLESFSYDDINEIAKIGTCLSDLYIMKSNIPLARRGVFSRQSYKKGEVVTISPAIITSRQLALADKKSILINYLISRDDTDVAILPVTHTGMINHAGKKMANLLMTWADNHSSLNRSLQEILAIHPRELASLPYAPLDIAYIADRDIAEGDELTIYYGSDWESAWLRYLDELMVWRSGEASPVRLSEKPEFRRHISIPDEMLPESGSFLVDCVALDFDCELTENRLKMDFNSFDTIEASKIRFMDEQCFPTER